MLCWGGVGPARGVCHAAVRQLVRHSVRPSDWLWGLLGAPHVAVVCEPWGLAPLLGSGLVVLQMRWTVGTDAKNVKRAWAGRSLSGRPGRWQHQGSARAAPRVAVASGGFERLCWRLQGTRCSDGPWCGI